MHRFLEVKIFAADRIIYKGKAARITLKFFNGNLEVMCGRKEYYASFDRGTITVFYGGEVVEHDVTLGFASSTGIDLTVLAAKAKKVTRESGTVSVGGRKKKIKYPDSFATDA
jgi:F0F1-type ATP synthase epsilon subunit